MTELHTDRKVALKQLKLQEKLANRSMLKDIATNGWTGFTNVLASAVNNDILAGAIAGWLALNTLKTLPDILRGFGWWKNPADVLFPGGIPNVGGGITPPGESPFEIPFTPPDSPNLFPYPHPTEPDKDWWYDDRWDWGRQSPIPDEGSLIVIPGNPPIFDVPEEKQPWWWDITEGLRNWRGTIY